MKIKKESFITIFYVLYFSWLFTITYIKPDIKTINAFSVIVVIFYFSFLRVKGDFFWFWLGAAIPIIANAFLFRTSFPEIDFFNLITTPIWIPVVWGTTFLALRKFYLIITK